MDHEVEFLRAFYGSRYSIDAGVRALWDYGQRAHRAAPWPTVRELTESAAEELELFQAWLRTAGRNDTGAIAFYLGISEDGASVCLFGCTAFDASDALFDWAGTGRVLGADWADSIVLDRFGLLSELVDSDIPLLLYVCCLGYVGLLAQHCAADLHQRPVAVGFLDGDTFLVLDARPG